MGSIIDAPWTGQRFTQNTMHLERGKGLHRTRCTLNGAKVYTEHDAPWMGQRFIQNTMHHEWGKGLYRTRCTLNGTKVYTELDEPWMGVMSVDTKKTVVLIFFIGNLNVQCMNFPKKMKDKKERKLSLITS